MPRRIRVLVPFALLFAVGRCLAVDTDLHADEQIVQKAKLPTDGPALLEHLNHKLHMDVDAAKVQKLIDQFGDTDSKVRDKAVTDMIAVGRDAVPYLRKALTRGDAAVVLRAQQCLQALDDDPYDTVKSAALRLLTARRPAGTVEFLLRYLPQTSHTMMVDEVRTALTRVAFAGAAPAPALLQGLHDRDAEVRGTVGEILARRSVTRFAAELHTLLADTDPHVRLRTARLLAEQRDADAVPVLCALLVEPSNEIGAEAGACLRELAGPLGPAAQQGKDLAARQKQRVAWEAWWRGQNEAAMLDRFRRATLTDARRAEIDALVRNLGDDDFSAREKASAALVEIGSAGVPLLLQARRANDAEVARRAQGCLEQIKQDPAKSNPASAARLLALLKPVAAARVLIAYRPFAHNEQSVEEIQSALNALALRDGKADAALLAALTDTDSNRRGSAAVALCQHDQARQLPEVRKLLQDRDPLVRMRVALALVRAKDRQALKTLIESFADVPADQLWPAEALLDQLAGDRAPTEGPGKTPAERASYREAWLRWLNGAGEKIDLDRLDSPRMLGYTLVVVPGTGRVYEIGRDGKPRWELNNLRHPFDAEVLSGGRVLVAEYQASKVTERNLRNEVLWEKDIRWPISCQRLANGNTFIATRNQLLEVDRAGKEIYTIQRQTHDVLSARKLRNGDIACILTAQRFVRLNTAGKELKGFGIGQVFNYVQFDVTASGGVLVPQQGAHKVVEFDGQGKEIWNAAIMFPISAVRLPNGRTLVSCMNPNQVVELDRAGKVVWQQQTDGAWRAKRR